MAELKELQPQLRAQTARPQAQYLVPDTAPAAALFALVAGAAVPSTPPFRTPISVVAEGVFEGWFAATAGVIADSAAARVPEGEPATAITGAMPAVDSGTLIVRPTLSFPLVRIRFARASASGVTPNSSATRTMVSPRRTRYRRGSGCPAKNSPGDKRAASMSAVHFCP